MAIPPLTSPQGGWGNKRYTIAAGSCGGRERQEGRDKGSRDLAERAVLIPSGARPVAQTERLALGPTADTFLGGSRNSPCSEIFPHMHVGSGNFSCPNARSIENFFRLCCHIKHRDRGELASN